MQNVNDVEVIHGLHNDSMKCFSVVNPCAVNTAPVIDEVVMSKQWRYSLHLLENEYLKTSPFVFTNLTFTSFSGLFLASWGI